MSDTENGKVILRWFDAVNQGDLHRLDGLADELFAPDFMEHDPRMPDFKPGPAGVKKFIHQVLRENRNVHVNIHDIFSCGDKTAYRFTVSMTNSASGKPVNVQLLAITRFSAGQFAEEWQLSITGRLVSGAIKS
jgi:ketosteroid isomerase-like protein